MRRLTASLASVILIAACGGQVPGSSSVATTSAAAATRSANATATPTPSSTATELVAAEQAASTGLSKVLNVPYGTCASGAACIRPDASTRLGVNAAVAYFTVSGSPQYACVTYVFKASDGWHYLESRCLGDQLLSPPLPVSVSVPTGCVNKRSTPSLSASVSGCVTGGTQVIIEGGPNYADGHLWWKLQSGGWMAHDYLLPGGQSEAHSVIDDTFPFDSRNGIYGVCGVSENLSACPFTDRLKQRLQAARITLCRCQNPSTDRTIGADKTLVGWTGHVRMWGRPMFDLLLIQVNGQLLVDDELCSGGDVSTSIYQIATPC